SSGNVVQGNFIGTDATGTNALGNVNDGISIDHAPNNEIGGTGSGEANLISGNRRDGIRFIDQSATGNVVEGNIIGLDITGRAGLGNNRNGIYLATALNNTIGGTDHGSRNLISGNNAWAIVVDNVGNGNVLQGNWIGLDILGSCRVPNGGGINCVAAQTSIGGTGPGAGNLISGNTNEGILLGGSHNVVQGNLIGTDASGTFPVPDGLLRGAPFG